MQYSEDLQGEEEEEEKKSVLLALVICGHRSRQSKAREVW